MVTHEIKRIYRSISQMSQSETREMTRSTEDASTDSTEPQPAVESTQRRTCSRSLLECFVFFTLSLIILILAVMLGTRMNCSSEQPSSDKNGCIVPTLSHEKPMTSSHRTSDAKTTTEMLPLPAFCSVEMQSVPLEIGNNSKVLRFLQEGFRLRRCGGFCNDPLRTCSSSEARETGSWVPALTVEKEEGQQVWVGLEEHLECQCACKIQEQDCSPKHYHENCQCFCKDESAMISCKTERWETHFWDEEECRCTCREQDRECSTGSKFDDDLCRCITTLEDFEDYHQY